MREWLRDARNKKGMSQQQVAQVVGISAPSYNNIENGKFAPKVINAKAIGVVLGVDWRRFYEDDDHENDAGI